MRQEIFGSYGKVTSVDLAVDKRVNLPKVDILGRRENCVQQYLVHLLRPVFLTPDIDLLVCGALRCGLACLGLFG